jgi:predicted nucleic acid-binding protein
MPLVVDASIVLAWCYPDERSDATDAVLADARAATVVVPPHFPAEVANALWVGLRGERLEAELMDAFVEALAALDIQVDAGPDIARLGDVAKGALKHKLTAYDSAYLELAHTLHCPLGTRDKELARAARRLGVPVVGMDA